MGLSVIITAGGIGKRMQSDLPKQFLTISGKPVLQWTIERFYDFDNKAQLLLTLPEDWIEYWEKLCDDHNFTIPHKVVAGGKERYHSIKNALNFVEGNVVLVHDGVRPLVDDKVISSVAHAAQQGKNCVPAVPVTSSLRKGGVEQSEAVDRSLYWEVQTPQGFPRSVLEKAYEASFSSQITDDASLVELMGQKITLVKGANENIKITNPIDLLFAEQLLGS